MRYSRVDERTYIVRLEKGEEIITALQDFAGKEQISNAQVEGIGSVENPTLAHYRVDSKKYSEKQIDGIFEITSLPGNIGLFEHKPVIHAHVTIGNEHMQLYGGHLVKGVVSATAELIITVYPTKLEKLYDEAIGLNLWNLPQDMKGEAQRSI